MENTIKTNELAGPTRSDALARKAWTAERQYRYGAAQRYSRFVDFMKLALPISAVGLLAVMILWSALHKTPVDISWKSEMTSVKNGRIEMVKPQLSFTDEEDRDILVEAEMASQAAGAPDRWALEHLRARVTPLEGSGYKLKADHGDLDSEKQLLDLAGNVLVESSEGYTFKALTAHVDLNEGRVTSEQPVEAQGGATRIVANRFEMWDRGDRFRFEGNVHFTSEPVDKTSGGKGQ